MTPGLSCDNFGCSLGNSHAVMICFAIVTGSFPTAHNRRCLLPTVTNSQSSTPVRKDLPIGQYNALRIWPPGNDSSSAAPYVALARFTNFSTCALRSRLSTFYYPVELYDSILFDFVIHNAVDSDGYIAPSDAAESDWPSRNVEFRDNAGDGGPRALSG